MRKDRVISCDLHFVKKLVEVTMQINTWEIIVY